MRTLLILPSAASIFEIRYRECAAHIYDPLAAGSTIGIPEDVQHNPENTGLKTITYLISFSSGKRTEAFLERRVMQSNKILLWTSISRSSWIGSSSAMSCMERKSWQCLKRFRPRLRQSPSAEGFGSR